MTQPHVGIDVSKRQLDVAIRGRPEEDDCLAQADGSRGTPKRNSRLDGAMRC